MSEHFVKQSYGKIWHFCHNNQGICFCTMTNDHIGEYEILLKDGQNDFDVLIDDSDTIHLICQNNEGDIIYLTYSNNDWHKLVILKSKSPTAYKKNFNIQRINNWINIFYTIEYKGMKMLTHQILENTSVAPIALDYISGNYCVTTDSSNNLYVLFFSHSQNCYVYKKYIWSKKEWSDFQKLEIPHTMQSPYLFIDGVDNIHVCGTIDNEVVYLSDGINKIAVGADPIFIQKDNLYIMWINKNDGKIHGVQSFDGGKTFQNPQEFMSGRFTNTKLYAISYTSFEKGLKAMHSYGFIIDDYAKFYLLTDFFNVLKTKPQPIQKTIKQEALEFEQKISPTPPTPKQKSAPKIDIPEDIEIAKIKIQISQILSGIDKINTKLNKMEKNCTINNFDNDDIKKINQHLAKLEMLINQSSNQKLWNLF